MSINLFPWEVIVALALVLGALMIVSLIFWAFSRDRGGRFPLKRVIVLILCIGAIVAPYQLVDRFPAKMQAGYTRSNWNTADTAFFLELQTPRYTQPREEVFNAALVAVRELGWTLVSQSAEAGTIFVRVPTMFGMYTDELSIAVVPDGGQTKIDLQAKSERVRTNLGAGRRQIASFIRTVDQQFGINRPTLR